MKQVRNDPLTLTEFRSHFLAAGKKAAYSGQFFAGRNRVLRSMRRLSIKISPRWG